MDNALGVCVCVRCDELAHHSRTPIACTGSRTGRADVAGLTADR